MSGKTKQQAIASDFMTAAELTKRLGYNSNQELWRRIRAGMIPLPHSKRSAQIYIWRRDWYEHFKETGKWPEDVLYQSNPSS